MHWIPEEVPLHGDVRDWNHKLNASEKNLLTQIFRFFTQADVDVAQGYLKNYIPMFKGNPEVAMMLSTFAAMEAVHVDAYSLLLDTIGMPEVEYMAFSKYKEMADKHAFFEAVSTESKSPSDIAKSIAVYSGFGEGLQLFSSFAILLNFSRFGKMRGMGQIVTWSILDETVHCKYMLELFRQFVAEHYEIWTDDFKKSLYDAARVMVELEDSFIDLAFEQGDIEGLSKDEVKKYIRYIADRRLLQMGLKTNFGVKKNPLPWLEEMLNSVEHANFFETRVTEYEKAPTTGQIKWA
jgi:ribonucleoside-diphosphate reductase beta chain